MKLDKITEELLVKFGDRKRKGRLDLVLNIRTREIYPVPKQIEHKEFIPTIPGYDNKNSSDYIPIQFRLKQGVVKEILTGASSYEADSKIRHKITDLKRAHAIAWELAANSFHVELKREKVYMKFAEL